MSTHSSKILSKPAENHQTYIMKFKVHEGEDSKTDTEGAHAEHQGLDSGFSTPHFHDVNSHIDTDREFLNDEKSKSEVVIRFTLSNLKEIQESTFSNTHYARNLPWRIMVQPSMKQKRIPVQHFLGVFLHCNNKSESSTWACYAHAELRLLKSNPSLQPFVKKIQHLFTPKKNYCGFYYFISLDDVLNPQNGFVRNECITLEAHVIADEPWDKCVSLKTKSVENANKPEDKSEKSVTIVEAPSVESKDMKNKVKAIEELFHISEAKLNDGATSVNVIQYINDNNISKYVPNRELEKVDVEEKVAENDDSEETKFEDCRAPESQHAVEKQEDRSYKQEDNSNNPNSADCSPEATQLESKCSETAREAQLRMLKSEQSFIDKQKEELRMKLSHLDEAKTSNMITTVTLLEEKISLIEKQLETEEKKRLTQQAKNYKLEKRVKDLEKDLQNERKKAEENSKMWAEKRRQLEEKLVKLEKQIKEDKPHPVGGFENSSEPFQARC